MIIDQFIASAEDKWNRLSGLVLLLPHGFEGQGPEHSSARLERFLAVPPKTTFRWPIRRRPRSTSICCGGRLCGRWRKPLVVLTPKSLLRHPKVVSPLDEFASGRFQRVLADGAWIPKP